MAKKVETVLCNHPDAWVVSSTSETTFFTSGELYHHDNLTINYNAAPHNAAHSITIKVSVESWDINGNKLNTITGYTNTITQNSNITGTITIPKNCYKYRLTITGIANKTQSGSISNISITANTAIAENLTLDYTGESWVTVNWDTELPDQRQKFRVALENSEGVNLVDAITTDYSAKLNLPHMRPQGYKVRVYSLGDGTNNGATMGTTETELLTYTTSLFCLPSEKASVELQGKGKYNVSLLNASGKVVKSQSITSDSNSSFNNTVKFNRDAAPNTVTELDNEYRIQVSAADVSSELTADPIRTCGSQVYKNESYLAQLVSDINGVYKDKFELVEETNGGTVRVSEVNNTIYQNAIVEFVLKSDTKQIDLRTDTLSSKGGYQAVIRFQAMRSNNGHTPKLQFFVADINNNILADITAPTIIVEDMSLVDRVVTLVVPATVNVPHKIIIRCTSDKANPNVTCTLKNLRISRHDNIATNVQLSSCGNNLNITWDIVNTDPSIENSYVAQILDETGSWFREQSTTVTSNSASISLLSQHITTGTHKVRVLTVKDGKTLGISALYSFVYIKAGETFDTGTTDNINFLMMGLEDNGNTGAINRAAQLTTSNTALSVNKVALQIKIKK
ncbi:MAG: hypothetical protein ACRC6R_07275, partial [Bacteroidales bacterium]